MRRFKVWPHLTIVALIFAALGGLVAVLWNRHERKVEAAKLPAAARVERVDGEVGLMRSPAGGNETTEWVEVTPNMPISAGDRIYARESSRAAVAFTGRNFARLEPNSALDVLYLEDGRTQLALRDGSAIFNVGALQPGGLFEVATPLGAVDLRQPGLYEIGLNNDGGAWVSVLSGLAQVAGLAGSGEINKGEMLTLLGATAADIVLSRFAPDYAGALLDDYYGYQYPGLYDGRYSDYNAYLNDPSYYDPSNRFVSYRYVADTIPGVWALDSYGDWQEVSGYGHVWRPRVEEGWVPYQQGSWMMDEPYGLTWVSTEPWGYAPYHYGRWANAGGQWYWVPEGVDATPSYAPALVAFVPLTEENVIGWVPLAPGDPYVPVSYDANWQPQYLTTAQPSPAQVVNLSVPGAVSFVSVNDFGRVINPGLLNRLDKNKLAKVRPVLDPLSVAILRQTALQAANDRRRVDIPPGIAKRLGDTQVFTSARPFAPPHREDLARALRAEPVPEEKKKQKLQFSDERHAGPAPAQAGAPAEEAAARGNKEDKRQAQALRIQERTQERSARRHNPKEQGAQGERVGGDAKAQPAPSGHTPPGHARQQQVPGQQKQGHGQASPQPKAQKQQGKGKGKGRP